MGAELARLVGGVPALHDAVELLGSLVFRVIPKPRRLDHAAALWCRHLLVLAGEIVFAQGAADLLEHLRRLALGMQGLARVAAEGLPSEHRLDPVQLVVIGDRREPHHLPRLLRQHMAGEVVPPGHARGQALVQPVHDQDDGAGPLVVQPARGCGRTTRSPLGVALATTLPRASAGRR